MPKVNGKNEGSIKVQMGTKRSTHTKIKVFGELNLDNILNKQLKLT